MRLRPSIIIARREFLQVARLRSFWFAVLSLPLLIGLTPVMADGFSKSEPTRLMIVDQSGTDLGKAVGSALERSYQAELMAALADYADDHKSPVRQAILVDDGGRNFTDEQIDTFVKAGGVNAAVARLGGEGGRLPGFEVPERKVILIEADSSFPAIDSTSFNSAVERTLSPTHHRDGPVNAILALGRVNERVPDATLWTSGRVDLGLSDRIDKVIVRQHRLRVLQGGNIQKETAEKLLLNGERVLQLASPGSKKDDMTLIVKGALPLTLSYALLMVLLITGSWILQGLVEERSGKLLEALLASVKPDHLLLGKIFGSLAIGLAIAMVWLTCAAVGAQLGSGDLVDAIRAAAKPLATPANVFVIVWFFLAGYIMISLVFVSIGVVSDSMRESQAYLTPVMLILMLPVMLMMQSAITGSGGIALAVMTWVPVYAPFAVLARLGNGITLTELAGAGLVVLVFIAAQVWFVLKLFRANLLASGRQGIGWSTWGLKKKRSV